LLILQVYPDRFLMKLVSFLFVGVFVVFVLLHIVVRLRHHRHNLLLRRRYCHCHCHCHHRYHYHYQHQHHDKEIFVIYPKIDSISYDHQLEIEFSLSLRSFCLDQDNIDQDILLSYLISTKLYYHVDFPIRIGVLHQ
jgi:hypothetical protein